MLLKDLHNFQYHLRVYMNKGNKMCRGVQYLMELYEGLMLLKYLPNLPRPSRIYVNKQIFKINQKEKSIN